MSKVSFLRRKIVDFNLDRWLISMVWRRIECYMIRCIDLRVSKMLRRKVLRKTLHRRIGIYRTWTVLLWGYESGGLVFYQRLVRPINVARVGVYDVRLSVWEEMISYKSCIACHFVLFEPVCSHGLDSPDWSGLSLLKSWIVSTFVFYQRNGKLCW